MASCGVRTFSWTFGVSTMSSSLPVALALIFLVEEPFDLLALVLEPVFFLLAESVAGVFGVLSFNFVAVFGVFAG